jgi:hypothetical protein
MSKNKSKIAHLRVGDEYACHVDRRWGSSVITSVKCADYVTCKNCLRVIGARQTAVSQEAPNAH